MPHLPKSLRTDIENTIRAKYVDKRQALDVQEAEAKRIAIRDIEICKEREKL